MSSKLKVSIIVAIYNIENFLPKCIDSILVQSYNDLEIILVDDGSTDKCPTICDEYEKRDHRIIVLHKPNGGLSDARNAGLDVANGDFITFIDGDDYYAPDAIEEMVKAAIESKADIICMGAAIVSSDYKNIRNEHPTEEMVTGNDYFKSICEGTKSPSVCTKLFRSKVVQYKRFNTKRLNEDFHFMLSILLEPCQMKMIPFVGYYYYQRKSSISHAGNKKSLYDAIQNCIDFMHRVAVDNPVMLPYIARMGIHQSSVMVQVIPEPVISGDNENLKKALECLKLCSPYLSCAKLPYHEKIIARCTMASPVITARILRKIRSIVK